MKQSSNYALIIVALNTTDIKAFFKLLQCCKEIYSQCKNYLHVRRESFKTFIRTVPENDIYIYYEYFLLPNGHIDGFHRIYIKDKLVDESFYCNGLRDGLARRWHLNGKLCQEAVFENNKLQGVMRRWYSNGILAEKINYENDLINGEYESWCETGMKDVKATYLANKVCKLKTWSDGKRIPTLCSSETVYTILPGFKSLQVIDD